MEVQDKSELCFPQLLNSSCRKPMIHWSKAVLVNTVMCFISLITVVLNLLVIISVSHFRQLHTPANILLLSLAVSDFLVGLFLMPLETIRFTTCWFLGDFMCVLYVYLVPQSLATSIGTIVLISTDRYVAICLPLHYPTRIIVVSVKYCVCICWLCAASLGFFYVNYGVTEPGRSNTCYGECKYVLNYIAGTVDLILNFIFPVTVIVVLYMRVFMVAVSQARAMRSHVKAVRLHHSVDLKPKKSELKAARTLGVLVVVYLMCYCPYYCYYFSAVDVNSQTYAFVVVFLLYFNSCLNPVIYSLVYPWFRKTVKCIATLRILQPGSCEANIL